MAKSQAAGTKSDSTTEDTNSEDVPVCGVIMPISATSSHSEGHWNDVQALLHRAISMAGFRPQNVWENSATDRVSERIIASLFQFPIAVADISDLNPNVMLELGLRLSSRKPTVVVINKGGVIPFDIRDFQAVAYPPDLNILGMEIFFEELSETITSKMAAAVDGEYSPFLSRVVVDVLSPQTREVGIVDLVLSRIDEIGRRIDRLEGRGNYGLAKTSLVKRKVNHLVSRSGSRYITTFYTLPVGSMDQFTEKIASISGVANTILHKSDEECDYVKVEIANSLSKAEQESARQQIGEVADQVGGYVGVEERRAEDIAL